MSSATTAHAHLFVTASATGEWTIPLWEFTFVGGSAATGVLVCGV